MTTDTNALRALHRTATTMAPPEDRISARQAIVNALPALLAYVRELERERDDAMYDVGQAADKAALAMRERCAQACEALKVNRPSDPLANAFDGACKTCAAAVRVLDA